MKVPDWGELVRCPSHTLHMAWSIHGRLTPTPDHDTAGPVAPSTQGRMLADAYRIKTRYTLARPTPRFLAISVAPRPSLRSRRTSSGLMLGLRPL